MKEFLASVAATIVIAIVAALILGSMDSSTAEYFSRSLIVKL